MTKGSYKDVVEPWFFNGSLIWPSQGDESSDVSEPFPPKLVSLIRDSLAQQRLLKATSAEAMNSEDRLSALETALASHARRLEQLEASLYYSEQNKNTVRQLQDLPQTLATRLREEAQRINGVTTAYVHPDGRRFMLAGPEWTPELSEAGADLAIRLQSELIPLGNMVIEGGYEALGDHVIEGWLRVFP